jgi:hypothetical protein
MRELEKLRIGKSASGMELNGRRVREAESLVLKLGVNLWY